MENPPVLHVKPLHMMNGSRKFKLFNVCLTQTYTKIHYCIWCSGNEKKRKMSTLKITISKLKFHLSCLYDLSSWCLDQGNLSYLMLIFIWHKHTQRYTIYMAYRDWKKKKMSTSKITIKVEIPPVHVQPFLMMNGSGKFCLCQLCETHSHFSGAMIEQTILDRK